ncbi:MAG TPA: hypothetical protein ENN32_07645 [Chloroflexi bacterium]|mgnify:CR=1 FL=1|nr:hypothetical protein [Chloroflexota bacterium]
MTTIYVIIGFVLLIAGRRALWLSVMGGVFVATTQFLSHFLFDMKASTITLIAAGASLAVLALYLFIEKTTIFILGAIGGGLVGIITVNSFFSLPTDPLLQSFVSFLAGSALGLLLIQLLFQWTMVVFSSLMGAYLVSGVIGELPLFRLTAMGLLTIAGLFIQTRLFQRKRSERNPSFDSYQTAD